MENRPTSEALLEHVGFLKAMARKLVFDESQADDVVQEALLVALEHRPRYRSRLRAWLAGITRNVANKSLRTKRRRLAHERKAARLEAQAPAVDVVARLDVQRRLVEEVQRLAEPYRSTVVHRFFDDRPPREIARRMGLPVKTVDTRLRRALQMLRARLDAAHHGDRRGWCIALAFLVPPERTALAGAGSAVAGAVMSSKTIAGVAAALTVTAFFAGWKLMPDGTTSRSRAQSGPSMIARSEYDQVVEDLDAAKRRNSELMGELAEAEEAASRAEAGDDAARKKAEAGKGAVSSAPRYIYAGTSEALKALDWKTIGESMHAMPPLLDKLRDAIVNDRDMPEDVGEIQRWNGPLITQALKLQKQNVPGTGINGAFTHPSMLVNLVHATLAQSKVPLGEEQQEALYEIGLRFVEEDMRRMAGYGESTLPLRKTLEENNLKDRFFLELDRMLTEAQRTVLHPAASRGWTTGDLFTSGLVWATVVRPLEFRTREDLRNSVTELVVRQFGLDESARSVVEGLVAKWSQAMSDEFLSVPHTAAVRIRIIRVDRIRKAAALTLAMEEEMVAQLPLTEKQRKAIDSTVPVPFRTVEK